jgi:integrase
MTLTDTRIKAAKPKGARYRIKDGLGLYLEVMPSGSRFWRYRYKLNGRENLFAMGEWCSAPCGETPEQAHARRDVARFTLAEARIERQRARDIVQRGQHPLVAKKAERLAQTLSKANTFETVSREFIALRIGSWSASHRQRFEGFMAANVYPDIGPLPVREVSSAAILALLRKVEARKATSLASTGRGIIGQVFRYAIAIGKADNDPTVALRGALTPHTTEHHRPLERGDIPEFFEALACMSRTNRQTQIALRLLAYLFPRPIELRSAPWSEFALDEAEWRLPPKRMKMRRPHIVPLSMQAVAILRELQVITGRQQWLFPNARRPMDCMSHNTLNAVIERMGFGGRFTPHGFRATASTMLHEAGLDTRLIELQLAHQDKNKSRASYNHSARLPERKVMMQAWANMLDAMTNRPAI